MKKITNQNAKKIYDYIRYDTNEIDKDILNSLINENSDLNNKSKYNSKKKYRRLKRYKIGMGRNCKSYFNICLAFDIETYTNQNTQMCNMFKWQFGINNNVISGRTWHEFIDLLDLIKEVVNPTQNQRVLIWVHNLGYEFQFMRNWLKIENENDNFFKETRKPIYVTSDGFFEFRDSMSMVSGNSLKKLAKDYTNTQKCVGDLDYTKPMSYLSELTEKEQCYCDNDVLILTEFSRYYFDKYMSINSNPLTLTSVLNVEVNRTCEEWLIKNNVDKSTYIGMLKNSKSKNIDEYIIAMNYIYRGGYTHANQLYVDTLFTENDKIFGFDFTSSYPSVMFLSYFPSQWEYSNCNNVGQLEKLCDNYCVTFKADFENISSTTNHTIESRSKTFNLVNATLDNGRVRKAEKMSVYLTELDYATYKEFYKWDKIIISQVKYTKRVPLHEYILTPMLNYYKIKDKLKKEHKSYSFEKSMVNTFYGLTCKRYNDNLTRYCDDRWWEEAGKSYDEQSSKRYYSEYIGIYVSAHARRNLLKTVYKLECNKCEVLYCDTDSLKILHYNKVAEKIINDYNDKINLKLVQRCRELKLDIVDYSDLGMFDLEYSKVIHFKMLGAKRYLISYINDEGVLEHNQTIAGLPKNYLFKRYVYKKVYEMFKNELCVNSCKLTSKYIDEPTEVWVNNVKHIEMSSIALVNCDFSLTINEMWLMEFKKLQEKNKNSEFRI